MSRWSGSLSLAGVRLRSAEGVFQDNYDLNGVVLNSQPEGLIIIIMTAIDWHLYYWLRASLAGSGRMMIGVPARPGPTHCLTT